MRPKEWIACALAVIAATLAPTPARAAADAYPSRPLRVVIPYPPGGPTDILGRFVAQELGRRLGQTFVVENRAGASGMIGAETVARAPADGYTLLVNASIHVIYPSLYKTMAFDPIRDFAAVSQIAQVPLVLVMRPDQPVKTVQDLIRAAKAEPDRFRFASSGNGAAPHLAGEAFKQAAGVQMQHIPYKGSSPALTDVMGGHVDLMFDSMPSSMPFIASGALRPIAVTTRERVAALPGVPTIEESGLKDFAISTWYAVWAPKGTPDAIVQKVSAEVARIVSDPAQKQKLAGLGAVPVGSTPHDFAQFEVAEAAMFADIVKRSGAKLD